MTMKATYSVRYEAVNAMLLNEFLNEHRKVEQQQRKIETLASQLDKVSSEVELLKSKDTSPTISNRSI